MRTALIAAITLMAGSALANPPLVHGVALHGPLTWALTDSTHQHYILPIYTDAKHAMPTKLLPLVKATGCDFIRLSVDPGPFMALNGASLTQLDKVFLSDIAAIRTAGLDVLVDLHPINLVQAYSYSAIESTGINSAFPAYLAAVKHVAHLLAPLGSAHIAFEPMNEPQLGYTPAEIAQWQQMMQQLFSVIRSESHDMTVIVTGGQGGSMEGLMNMNPAMFDKYSLYSFHYYLPYIFTNQGVPGSAANPTTLPQAYAYGLPYPASNGSYHSFLPIFKQQVKSDHNLSATDQANIIDLGQPLIETYFTNNTSRATMTADFTKVSHWAAEHSIGRSQIFLGEFDATQKGPIFQGANPADRLRWLSDIREEAEAQGFHWSLWSVNDAVDSHGMVLVAVQNENTIDEPTAHALGLK